MLIIILSLAGFSARKPDADRVRLGCFVGGKTYLFYRLYVLGDFKEEGIAVDYYSQHMQANEGSDFILIPPTHNEAFNYKKESEDGKFFGKVTGERIIEGIKNKVLDGGTIGMSAFIQAVSEGVPIVAVAMLGHDSKEKPAKAILLGKGVKIYGPDDFRGKTLVSRRSTFGDNIFLREFVASIGLSERDVNIIEGVPEDEMISRMVNGDIDGGLYHVGSLKKLVKRSGSHIYRLMDWMNPELSQALLVFDKEFLKENPEKVKKIVRAYMKRISSEEQLPAEKKSDLKKRRWGMLRSTPFRGMDLPRHDFPPLVRADLIQEMQRLSLKYGYIERIDDIKPYVNNSIVDEVYREFKTNDEKWEAVSY